MNLRITGKHMDIGDAFRSRIESRISEAVEKYFDGGFSGRVTVEKSGSRFTSDCLVHLDTGITLQATGVAQEPQSSFDAAAERVEKRLRRYKRRLKSHSVASQEAAESIEMSYRVIAPVADEDDEVPEDYAPAVIAEHTMALTTMTVAAAAIELDTKDNPIFIFRNAGNRHVNIVYRRADGNIGWVDTAATENR